jgi:hypothetical protein
MITDPAVLVLHNQSTFPSSVVPANITTLIVIGNYSPAELNYADFTNLVTLKMFDGTMTSDLRTQVTNLITANVLQSLEIPIWGTTSFSGGGQTNIRTISGFHDVTHIGGFGGSQIRTLTGFENVVYCGGFNYAEVLSSLPPMLNLRTVSSWCFDATWKFRVFTVSDLLSSVGEGGFYNSMIHTVNMVLRKMPSNSLVTACSLLRNTKCTVNPSTLNFSIGADVVENVPNITAYVNEVLDIALDAVPFKNATSRTLDLSSVVANTTGLTQHGGLIDVIKIGSSSYTWNGSAWA